MFMEEDRSNLRQAFERASRGLFDVSYPFQPSVSAADPLIRWDSYENFREGESPVPQGDGRSVSSAAVGGEGGGGDRGRGSAASCSSASTTSPLTPSQSTPCSSTSSPPPHRRSPSPFSSTSPLPVVAELQDEDGIESRM